MKLSSCCICPFVKSSRYGYTVNNTYAAKLCDLPIKSFKPLLFVTTHNALWFSFIPQIAPSIPDGRVRSLVRKLVLKSRDTLASLIIGPVPNELILSR